MIALTVRRYLRRARMFGRGFVNGWRNPDRCEHGLAVDLDDPGACQVCDLCYTCGRIVRWDGEVCSVCGRIWGES